MNKEAIAHEIQSELTEDGVAMGIAQSILDLKYKCKECKGDKEVWLKGGMRGIKQREVCPICKGTGLGEPMIGVLSENQEPPLNTLEISQIDYDYVIKYVIKQGWRKVE
jgi:hypothetical protein